MGEKLLEILLALLNLFSNKQKQKERLQEIELFLENFRSNDSPHVVDKTLIELKFISLYDFILPEKIIRSIIYSEDSGRILFNLKRAGSKLTFKNGKVSYRFPNDRYADIFWAIGAFLALIYFFFVSWAGVMQDGFSFLFFFGCFGIAFFVLTLNLFIHSFINMSHAKKVIELCDKNHINLDETQQ